MYMREERRGSPVALEQVFGFVLVRRVDGHDHLKVERDDSENEGHAADRTWPSGQTQERGGVACGATFFNTFSLIALQTSSLLISSEIISLDTLTTCCWTPASAVQAKLALLA